MNINGTIFKNQPIANGVVKSEKKFNIAGQKTRKSPGDTFAYGRRRQSLARLYSASDVKAKPAPATAYTESDSTSKKMDAPEAQSVQAVSAASGTSKYYNVITNICAKKAGVSVSASGTPNINSGIESTAYNKELNRIQGAFWCQTGGWSNLNGNGSSECMRTALATMVSINSGGTVTPDDTGDGAMSVTVGGTKVSREDGGTYNLSAGADSGFSIYSFNSAADIINAINNELKNDRSVVVKTTVSGMHWVTVTGTKNGKPATSFSDFIGVDPWYNGNNENNPSPGSGSGATRKDLSGVITLSSVSGQNLHSDYKILTYR